MQLTALAARFMVAAMFLAPAALVAQRTATQDPAQNAITRVPPLGPTRVITLSEFLGTVERANPDYAAQRAMVDVADAQRRVARLFPNPVISAGYSADVTGAHLPTVVSPGLSQTVLLGGKISARSDVADQSYAQSTAQVADFRRGLLATAANAYVDALVAELAADRRRQSAEAVDRLAAANEARFQAGEIGEADQLQSRVERLSFRADYLAAESSRRAALLALSALMGIRGSDSVYVPSPYREVGPQAFDLHALIDSALTRRPDVVAARRATDVARAGVRLTRANRVSDVDVGLSIQHSSRSENLIAPSPAWQAAGLSLSFAIPLTNAVNSGDLDVAHHALEQARHAQASAEVRAESDVRQAHARYLLAVERLGAYSGELLTDAERVLAARTYSYQRGSAPLTDVLIAQQALNDAYLSYFDSLGEYLKARVGLQQAAGFVTVGF
jgi:outer membrane protein, heavy metal efflux system